MPPFHATVWILTRPSRLALTEHGAMGTGVAPRSLQTPTERQSLANRATTSWVCAILDEWGVWHHLRGIT
jgi:hypothetical protein